MKSTLIVGLFVATVVLTSVGVWAASACTGQAKCCAPTASCSGDCCK